MGLPMPRLLLPNRCGTKRFWVGGKGSGEGIGERPSPQTQVSILSTSTNCSSGSVCTLLSSSPNEHCIYPHTLQVQRLSRGGKEARFRRIGGKQRWGHRGEVSSIWTRGARRKLAKGIRHRKRKSTPESSSGRDFSTMNQKDSQLQDSFFLLTNRALINASHS